MEKQGQKNKYVCEKCGGSFITVNLDDGTTPFMAQCRAKWPGECKGFAQSQFYRVDQPEAAQWCWYRPDVEEVNRLDSIHPGVRQHVENGGLVMRRLDNAEREIHGGHRVRQG